MELQRLTSDGLNPTDYALQPLIQLRRRQAKGQPLSDCEARLASLAYLEALHDLRFGRVNPVDKGLLWLAPNMRLSHQQRQAKLVELARIGRVSVHQAFSQARPQNDNYWELRSAYVKAQASLPDSWPRVSAGSSLKQGDSSQRVVELRRRLRAGGYLTLWPSDADDLRYFDAPLALALRRFQREHGLQADGILGARSVAQLNIQPAQRLQQLRANLERLRWLPRGQRDEVLLVDIAAQRLVYYRHGDVLWSTRVQVGEPDRRTPALVSRLSYITMNPTWRIPQRIYKEEVLPKIQQDQRYLARNNITAYNVYGMVMLPRRVNWQDPPPLKLVQAAGPNAALGQVAFRFANPFSVYLHDTPSASLFKRPRRFFSHGCVRVEDAMTLAKLLFRQADEPTREAFARLRRDGETRNLQLPHDLPLLMLYLTARADAAGKVQYRPDTYQRDQNLIRLLGS